MDYSPLRGSTIGDRKRIMVPAFDTLHGIGDEARVKTTHLQLLSKYTKTLADRAFGAVIRARRHRYARRTVYMNQDRILPLSFIRSFIR
jgi:hypothetical protein